jgi:hypothetical protein
MPIPTNELFEEFIRRSRVVEHPTSTATLLSMAVGQPTLYLEHPQLDITLDAVLRVISRELEAVGCAGTRHIALATLAAIASTADSDVSAVDHANACLSHVHTSDVFQYLVLPSTCRRDYETAFGEFTIRPFDPDRLLYWARRGGSSYPLDLNALAGRTALERDRFATPILNWDALPAAAWRAAHQRNAILPQAVQDIYYAAVADHHFREIPTLIRDRTRVLEAGSLVHLDVESLFDAMFSQRLGLFRWDSDSGKQRTWAVLSTMRGFNVNLAPPELVAQCRGWLETELGFVGLDPTKPLDRTLDAFCGLLQRAHDHRLNDRLDEAALHFVIALDFLLGSERRSTESVSERAAVLVYRPLGRTLDDQARRIRHVYDARSKYVHEGRAIPKPEIAEAERVATEVLWALLAVSGRGAVTTTSQWLNKVDYVLAALRDGRAVAEEDLVAIGGHGSSMRMPPPNRVVSSAYERN